MLTACKDEPVCCVNIDTQIGLHYMNREGKNLLDFAEHYQKEDIKVYYKKGDEFEYVYNGNLDAPNMHHVYYTPDSALILAVYASDYYEGETSTTLISFNETVFDTLYCEFDIQDNGVSIKKAWLNGVAIEEQFMEIIREE
ncbi:hypothetical protein GCM10023331_28570 [Algivirga pacifica]|uniref:Uncharacterized protein n=2 Tax=Algivirga pacifica TaxID=1162670 RepID=A0ABP9DI17_9BACT